MHLKDDGYVWAVTYISRDDGTRCTAGYFTSYREAESFCRKREYGDDQRVVQTTLFHDEDGCYYEVTLRPVQVDQHVIKRNALSKLTDSEKRALGLL